MVQRFADEMDRVFEDFGVGRSWLLPRMGGRWLEPWRELGSEFEAWTPAIEVSIETTSLWSAPTCRA